MSFGWSAGDIVTAVTFVNKIVQCVRSSGGAREHFQELETELQALSRALREISDLTKAAGQIPEIVALKFAACSCNDTLKAFLMKIEPFNKKLGAASQSSRMKAAPRMVRWELLIRKDIPEFRTYLVAHVGFLQLRLNTAVLKITARSLQDARRSHENQQDASEATHRSLVSHMQTMHAQISLIPQENTVPKLDSLMSITNNVLEGQNKMMQMVEKGLRNPAPDLNHTWPQPPMKFEDLFGNVMPIPAEFNWDMVESVIRAKFKQDARVGSSKVRSGQWKLYDVLSRNGPSLIDPDFFLPDPGMHVIMTFVMGQFAVPNCCPKSGCPSQYIVASETDPGRKCSRCNISFQKVKALFPILLRPHLKSSRDIEAREDEWENEWENEWADYKVIKYFLDADPEKGARHERKLYKSLSVYSWDVSLRNPMYVGKILQLTKDEKDKKIDVQGKRPQ